MGIVSALGIGADIHLKALADQVHGIGKLQHVQTPLQETMVFGECRHSNTELRSVLSMSETLPFSRTGLLASVAFRECISNSGLDSSNIDVISSTSTGGIDRSEIYYGNLKKNGNGSFSDLIVHDAGDVVRRLCNFFQVKGKQMTISTACSSSANAIMLGAKMIEMKKSQAVIVGGADALTSFTINGFNSLKILDPQHCKPFSQDRNGLNLGEGAAYLLLEPLEQAKERNASILGCVSGYANSNDAYHQTASSPEGDGATQAMSGALQKAGLTSDQIDYVNVHGTGTQNNDASEGQALLNVFGTPPAFSSTKAHTGHTLAAAGSVEAIISLLTMSSGTIFPNLNYTQPMTNPKVVPVTAPKTGIVMSHILSNSFGFGGNNTSLIFSKVI